MTHSFEVAYAVQGPLSDRIRVTEPWPVFSPEDGPDARQFANGVARKLLTEDRFQFARPAYIRDLKTGRFV